MCEHDIQMDAVETPRVLTDLDGEKLCRRIDHLDLDQARAALRYLALGIGGRSSKDAEEVIRAVRHGERWPALVVGDDQPEPGTPG